MVYVRNGTRRATTAPQVTTGMWLCARTREAVAKLAAISVAAPVKFVNAIDDARTKEAQATNLALRHVTKAVAIGNNAHSVPGDSERYGFNEEYI